MAEEKILAVTANLKGQEVDVFNAIREEIVARYKGVPGFRPSNSAVMRTILLLFSEYYKKAIQYDLLIQFLKKRSPEILREFENHAKELEVPL